MRIIITITLFLYSLTAIALEATITMKDKQGEESPVYLQDHEPNILGLRYDKDDDDVFLDFKISLQYPLFKSLFDKFVDTRLRESKIKKLCQNALFDDCYLYLAFTGRFGQYIDMGDFGRESSPVVSKRFNPKLFWRFEKNDQYYIDFEYGHESNGQSITKKTSYDSLADELAARDKGERSHANDYISRGWDYYGITAKYVQYDKKDKKLTFYLSLKRFIGGKFQGEIEEYYPDFEAPREITSRQQVDGVSFMTKWKVDTQFANWLKGYKIAAILQTGLDDFAEYNTAQLELSTRLFDIPFMLWVRRGYTNNLSEYYKDDLSVGFALELRTFE